jgi:Tfp pilus assembly protein PilN
MRAINLMPPEDRGERRPTRTGSLAYVVLGGLVLALAGVTMVVMTGNSISEKQSEVSSLQQRQTELQSEISKVQSYSDLAALEQGRVETVKSLAQSRFDWSRALRELALVIPSDVWLTDLTGTVSPEVTLASGSGGSDLRSQASGPALTLNGCANGHDAVASFLDDLRDIDGVTRVAVSSSDKGSGSSGSSTGAASAASSGCSIRDFLVTFNIVVAFDPVAAPAAAPTDPSATAATATTSAATSTTTTGADGGVSGVQGQEQQTRDSISRQSTKAHNTVNAIVPGTVGG